MRVYTPSNMPIWWGHRIEGEKFTAEQLRMMAYEGIDPNTVLSVEYVRTVPEREVWRPHGHAPITETYDCPVLTKPRRDGKVQVISPAGVKKWIKP